MNYSRFLYYPNETQPLVFPFNMMKHGEKVDMAPMNLGGDKRLYVYEEYLPFYWYNEKLYYNIQKTTEEYLEQLESSEINSSTLNYIKETTYPHQTVNTKCHQTYPSQNGEKLDTIPEEIVQQTLNNSTHI